MTVREAIRSDAAALSIIYGYYVENFPYSFEYIAPSADEFAERITAISGDFPFFVCEDNGEIAGFAYAHQFKERKAYQWICETSIYAKNGCSQKGVGSMLYSSLLPALKRQGFVRAFAVIGCPNEGSEIFHKKMNFSFVATFPDLGYKLGSWHDVKYYAYELNPIYDNMPDPIEYRNLKHDDHKHTELEHNGLICNDLEHNNLKYDDLEYKEKAANIIDSLSDSPLSDDSIW